MRRLVLLAEMAALLALIAAVVMFASPYDAPVAGYVPIKELWAIEDERRESDAPLVTALTCNGAPLAYDAQENTFYCTLGLEHGEEWPQLRLSVPGAQGVTVCFADDYEYDRCADAVREGYSYELMAYTDSEYAYFNLVFTGLPLLCIETEGEIGGKDAQTVASVSISNWSEETALCANALVNLRGDGSYYNEKKSYKLKFIRSRARQSSVLVDVPGMGGEKELLLLGMVSDPQMLRERLCWDMAALAPEQQGAFSARRTQYVEVFINGGYSGVYLMMEPYDVGEEISRAGAQAPMTDSLYRSFVSSMSKDRPYLSVDGCGSFELFHAPNEGGEFAALQPYLDLMGMDDGEFIRAAEEYLDLDSLLRYELLVQAMGLADNAGNNMYVWAHREGGKIRYRFELWDMDLSWDFDPGQEYDHWFVLAVHDRAINLDVGGARGRLRALWRQMRADGFTAETVAQYVESYAHELLDSGAYARNAARWSVENAELSTEGLVWCARGRFEMLDLLTEALCAQSGPMAFLDGAREGNGYAVATGEMLARLRQQE